jgi:hypothetical protein
MRALGAGDAEVQGLVEVDGAVHVADVQFGAVGAMTFRPPRNLDFSDDA